MARACEGLAALLGALVWLTACGGGGPAAETGSATEVITETSPTTGEPPTSSDDGTTFVGVDVGAAVPLATGDHACVIDVEGGVWCWGSNLYGVAGTGKPGGTVPTPRRAAGLAGIVDLGSQGGSTCAVRDDGALFCWGAYLGGLIDDPNEFTGTPTQAPGVTDVLEIEGGSGFLCLRYKDGTVACRGANEYGQLADGSFEDRDALATVAGVAGATAFTVGLGHVCVVTGGPVTCWGNRGNGVTAMNDADPTVPTVIDGITDAVTISSSFNLTCIVRTDGGVTCWGQQIYGSFADGTDAEQKDVPPTPIPGLDDVVEVSVGEYNACAVTADHELWCWGYNGVGQVGDGTQNNRLSPYQVPLTGVHVSTVGSFVGFTCATDEDAALWCWGSNSSQKLGIDADKDAVPFLMSPQRVHLLE